MESSDDANAKSTEYRLEDNDNNALKLEERNKRNEDTDPPICPGWTGFTNLLHSGIISLAVTLSLVAVRRPWTVVISISVLSIFIVTAGLATNFNAVHDPQEFLIPSGTPIEGENQWMMDTFKDSKDLYLSVVLHERGGNVLTVNTTRKALELMDAFWATEGFHEVCDKGEYIDVYGQRTCWTYTVGRFWNHNLVYYDAMAKTDLDVQEQVSQWAFPYGQTPVSHDGIMGNSKRGSNDTYLITSAESFLISLAMPPDVEGVYELQSALVETCLKLREEWGQLPHPVHLEFVSELSFETEVERAMEGDLPLLPVVFVIMGNFCSLVFWQKHKIKSRWLLGYGAVLTVVFSILTGFGILFIVGVPVTSMLMFLPFVIFGVGLDDTFIITGAFFRTHQGLTIEDRIIMTMKEIGLSITLTTTTTMVAFFLSSMSSIRAVRWLGWYALVTIFIDAIYQVTFYVALLTLDERRIQARRRDICFCIIVPKEVEVPAGTTDDHQSNTIPEKHLTQPLVDLGQDESTTVQAKTSSENGAASDAMDRKTFFVDSTTVTFCESETGQQVEDVTDSDSDQPVTNTADAQPVEKEEEEDGVTHNFADRLMLWYSRRLVPQKWFHFVVWIVFVGYFVLCCHRTTLLRQEFKTQDFVPDDSYIRDYIDAVISYRSYTAMIGAYFRNVNQSDPVVQDEMRAYMDDMLALEHVGSGDTPHFCWVKDFPKLRAFYGSQMENMTFTEQMTAALDIPAVKEIYGWDIIQDNVTGEIIASRCWIYLNHIDINDVNDQLEYYADQHEVTLAQPINQGRRETAFFSLEGVYFTWEFFSAISRELTFTTISGVVAVSCIGFLLIPHWSAVCFVLPMIIVLYIDLMGTIEMMGLHIDSMVFVCIIVSVGLLVDFLMHMLLRYYESSGSTRLEKVQLTLKTMGASIFIGGLSTFLGILPLSIGTSTVMRIVFRCFFAMVTLGVTHGLVFLPVLLCLIGPINKPVRLDPPYPVSLSQAPSTDQESTEPADHKDESAQNFDQAVEGKEDSEPTLLSALCAQEEESPRSSYRVVPTKLFVHQEEETDLDQVSPLSLVGEDTTPNTDEAHPRYPSFHRQEATQSMPCVSDGIEDTLLSPSSSDLSEIEV